MSTYQQIQEFVREKYGFTVKTCWIAHVKEISGLTPRIAPNRTDNTKRINPCPPDKIEPIKQALRHFGII